MFHAGVWEIPYGNEAVFTQARSFAAEPAATRYRAENLLVNDAWILGGDLKFSPAIKPKCEICFSVNLYLWMKL